MSASKSWDVLWSPKKWNTKDLLYVRAQIWLLSWHPDHMKQWSLFLFSRHSFQRMGWGETEEAVKLCSLTTGSKCNRMFPSTYFSTGHWLPSSIPILHDRTLQMIFYHWQLSLVATLICFPRTLVFPLPLEWPTTGILPLPVTPRSRM